MASVSDQEIMRFMDRMSTLTGRLLEETRNDGQDGLARVITEMRTICNDMTRQMGQNPNTPVDVDKLELKVKAFDLQMSTRFKSAPGAPGIKTIATLFQQLQSEVNRFKTLVERSVWH
jgi:DNA-directed RNA polymerase alpha subunit